MARCVVLGANGFIGSHVVSLLAGEGHLVRACDLSRSFEQLADVPGVERLTLDFLDSASLQEALQDAEWVFHLVSTTLPASSKRNMVFDVESNVCGTLRLLEACCRVGVQKLVFASSGGTVYGEPERLPVQEGDPLKPRVSYGVVKATIEQYLRIYASDLGLSSVALRLSNPYGSGHQGTSQGAIPVFMRRAISQEPIEIWGDGTIVRDYVYVEDVARAFVAAAKYTGQERVFNIGSGQGTTLNELIRRIDELSEKPCQVKYLSQRGFDIQRIFLDVSLAKQELGWTPSTSLAEGMKKTFRAISNEQ